MVDMRKDLENPPVADAVKEAVSNSTEILDLSFRRTMQSLETTNIPRLPSASCIPSNKMDQQQSIQQPSINNTALTPINLHMEIGTAKFLEKSPQKREEQCDNDGKINYYQINNVQINGQINNDRVHNSQINCNQINVDKMLHEPFKNGQIDKNYINVNQTIAKDINSNTSYKSSLLPLGQSMLRQPIPMAKPISVPYLPTNNISVPNVHPMPLSMAMSMQEIEKSSILTSIAKAPRPFKVYPKDPLALSAGDKDTSEAYNTFRQNVLQHVRYEKEGTNNKMRRISNSSNSLMSSVDDDEKNRAYLEKRKKNNAAAKRSRDARRAKEDEIAIRAAYLEQENNSLKKTLHVILKQLQEQNVQLDFRSLIETNENVLGLGTIHSSS